MDAIHLPTLNAGLNTAALILLLCGFIAIKKNNRKLHAGFMIGAVVVSGLFLTSYLIYHYSAGHVKYEQEGAIRYIYYTILITHVILAAVVPFLAIFLLLSAWKQQFERHKRVARWAFPVWVYVSVTGVIVYLMLYQMG